MHSEVGAQQFDREVPAEQLEQEIDIFLYVIIDGMANCNAQKIMRDRWRSGLGRKSLKKGSLASSSGQTVYEYVNPKAEFGENDVEDATHIHKEIQVDFSRYDAPFAEYRRTLDRLKREIDRYVQSFCIRPYTSAVRVHGNVLCYNQGDIASRVIGSVGSEDDEVINEKLSELFEDRFFLRHKKIKYKKVEYLAFLDLIGSTTELCPNSAGFTTGTGDYKNITAADNDEVIDRNIPSNQDIIDAAVLCQLTYDNQSPIERSVIDWKNELKKEVGDFLVAESAQKFRGVWQKGENIAEALLDTWDWKSSVSTAASLIFELTAGTTPVPMETVNLVQRFVFKKYKELKEKTDRQPLHSEREAENRKKASIQVDMGGRKEKVEVDWHMMSVSEIEELLDGKSVWLKNYLTGFYSLLYKKIGEEKYAYCTCGTNFTSVNDWLFTNIYQGLTGLSAQHSQSVHVAKILDKAVKKRNGVLHFIGHSLGGGLASNNALATKDRHAITFNAAGLHIYRVLGTLLVNNAKDLFHPNKRKEKIHAFVLEGEVLNWLMKPIAQGAYGTVKTIRIGEDEKILKEVKGRVAKHAMTNFINLKHKELLRVKD